MVFGLENSFLRVIKYLKVSLFLVVMKLEIFAKILGTLTDADIIRIWMAVKTLLRGTNAIFACMSLLLLSSRWEPFEV